MRRFYKLFGGITLLLAGLNACSKMTVDTEFLTGDSLINPWIQVHPAGRYDGGKPCWTFQTDGIVSIFEGGYGVGGCIPDYYSFAVKGKTLELLPPIFSSAYYEWDDPFTFRILQCTETKLRLKLLSIPKGVKTAGLSASSGIIELERTE
jgi:hypothetical protein